MLTVFLLFRWWVLQSVVIHLSLLQYIWVLGSKGFKEQSACYKLKFTKQWCAGQLNSLLLEHSPVQGFNGYLTCLDIKYIRICGNVFAMEITNIWNYLKSNRKSVLSENGSLRYTTSLDCLSTCAPHPSCFEQTTLTVLCFRASVFLMSSSALPTCECLKMSLAMASRSVMSGM